MKCKKYDPPFQPLDPSEFDEPYRRNYVPGGKITPMVSNAKPRGVEPKMKNKVGVVWKPRT